MPARRPISRTDAPSITQHVAAEKAAALSTLWIIGVLFLAWGLYALVFLGLLLGHVGWLAHRLLPALKHVAVFCGVALIPLCLVLSVLPRTRLLSGLGFVAVSGAWTFITCAYSAIYTYVTWNWIGLVAGTALVGYGIMPTAILSAAAGHKYTVIGQILSGGIMLFSCLYFGLVLIAMAVSTHTHPPQKMPSDIDVG